MSERFRRLRRLRRREVTVTVLAGVAVGLGAPSMVAASAPPGDTTPDAAVASDHAQVIAQGVIEFGDGDNHWVQTSQPVGVAAPLGPGGPTSC